MKLEFINDISAGGKFNIEPDDIMRLFDFDMNQAIDLRQIIRQTIIENKESLDLKNVDFIECINCNLMLRIAESDNGITTLDKRNFFCDLTISGYEEMVFLMEPFCNKESFGYQWLYNIDTPTDFLFSPSGDW